LRQVYLIRYDFPYTWTSTTISVRAILPKLLFRGKCNTMASILRICWNIFPLLFSLIALCFTLLVIISGTSAHNDLANVYFMRINTTDIISSSVPDSGAYNTIAESLGLHDFYQTSLWGYCEGDNTPNGSNNVTFCSKPAALYWFDPVSIFSNELFSGQSVVIPSSIQNDFNKVETASHWMFAMYLVGVILVFLEVLIGFTTLCTRVGSVITTIVSFLAFLFVAAATVVAQVMFAIYRNAINNSITQFNVQASLGTTMFAFGWAATAAAAAAFIGFLFGICCGTGESRRWRRRGEKDMLLT